MPKDKRSGKLPRPRKENDSLGSVKIPGDAPYGAQTARAIQNFPISGRAAHPALIRAYLRVKSAAARANFRCRSISKREFDLIRAAIVDIERMPETEWKRIFPVDIFQAGAGTSQNMNINEVIANFANKKAGNSFGNYAPIHPNDHVNRSQSTNDTFPTAMRLALIEVSGSLVREVENLSHSLQRKSNEWARIPKSARTHLQDAVPMTLGQEFKAYSTTVRKCAKWLENGRDELREIGIGGSAAGTGLNVPKDYPAIIVAELSQLTGERLRLAENLCEAMQSQSPSSYFFGMLRLLALELTRICNDLRLLASGPLTGLGEISLPAVQPGSSIMPGKVNPSIVEMANQSWFYVLGVDQSIGYAVQAGQLELNVMMPLMAHLSIDATEVATNAMKILRTRCIDGLRANEPALRRYFESTPQIATALSPRLGYSQTAKIVEEAVEKGISVIDLIRKRKLIPEKELTALLDVRSLTRSF